MKASVFSLFQTFLLVIGVVVVMVAAVPWIAIPVIPLGIIFFFLQRYFLDEMVPPCGFDLHFSDNE